MSQLHKLLMLAKENHSKEIRIHLLKIDAFKLSLSSKELLFNIIKNSKIKFIYMRQHILYFVKKNIKLIFTANFTSYIFRDTLAHSIDSETLQKIEQCPDSCKWIHVAKPFQFEYDKLYLRWMNGNPNPLVNVRSLHSIPQGGLKNFYEGIDGAKLTY